MTFNSTGHRRIILSACLSVHILVFACMAKQSIALSDLAAQGVDASVSSIISDRLRNELFATGLFTVVERSQMQQILKEQGFQQSGCTSDACAVEVGQLLGVQYIAVGSVGLLGKTYTLNVRLIDVRTGQIIQSASEDCRCEIDDLLKKSVQRIAVQLSQVVQEKAPSDTGSQASHLSKYKSASVSPDQNDRVLQTGSTGSKSTSGKPVAEKSAKSRFVFRVLAGAAAVCATGAGLYFNNEIRNETTQRTNLYNQYISAGGAMDREHVSGPV